MRTNKTALIALALFLAAIALPTVAQGITNVGSRWESGSLVFYDVSTGTAVATIAPTFIDVAGLKLGGVSITSTAAELNALDGITSSVTELNQYSVQTVFLDAGTAGSAFVVVPHAGTIKAVSVVNNAASTTTKTVFTAKIGGVSVTHPACEIALAAAAGTKTTVVPTANNVVTADSVIEVASDGGTDASMPVVVTLLIER